MSNIVLNVITAALDTTVYGDIAGEIGRAIAGGDGVAEGVVELGRGRFEILFGIAPLAAILPEYCSIAG